MRHCEKAEFSLIFIFPDRAFFRQNKKSRRSCGKTQKNLAFRTRFFGAPSESRTPDTMIKSYILACQSPHKAKSEPVKLKLLPRDIFFQIEKFAPCLRLKILLCHVVNFNLGSSSRTRRERDGKGKPPIRFSRPGQKVNQLNKLNRLCSELSLPAGSTVSPPQRTLSP